MTTIARTEADFAGRFRLGAVLGSGAEATVYRATDLSTGRPAAVKIFRKPAEGSLQRREVLIQSRIRHRHIVALTGHGGSAAGPGQTDYAALELVEGRSLRAVLSSGAADPALAAAWLRCLLKALMHIHARGIVHHDIKPSNILIPHTPDGQVSGEAKLADFGIATSSAVPSASSGSGTAHYMSPEQAAGAEAGTAGDIYSLGLVALECLTGSRPFPGTPLESMVARTLRPPQVPATVDRRWARLITAMTTLDPAERATARQALRLLRRALPPA